MTLNDFVRDIPNFFQVKYYELIAFLNLSNVNLCWPRVFVTLNVS